MSCCSAEAEFSQTQLPPPPSGLEPGTVASAPQALTHWATSSAKGSVRTQSTTCISIYADLRQAKPEEANAFRTLAPLGLYIYSHLRASEFYYNLHDILSCRSVVAEFSQTQLPLPLSGFEPGSVASAPQALIHWATASAKGSVRTQSTICISI